jgi:hypothetical protein
LDITNPDLLDPNIPQTLRVSTTEEGAGVDFVPLDEMVTLIQSETRQCFDIETIDDDVVEPIEIIRVRLSEAVGVTFGMSEATISITDDGDMVTVGFMSTTLIGTEGIPISVCIEVLTGSVQLPSLVDVGLEATDITAMDIADYVLVDNLINIPNGAIVGSTFCVDVSLSNDGAVEVLEEETFSISLTTPGVMLVVIPDTNLTVTIIDADVGRVRVTSPLTVTEGDASFEIVIAVAEGIILLERDLVYGVQLIADTAEVNTDYLPLPSTMVTFSVGLTSTMMANVPVQIINDDVGEPDESFFVTLIPMSSDNDEGLSVPITILDDEPRCDSLEDPENGDVTVTGLHQGSTATYTCDITHELIGESMRTCDSNAMWTNLAPTCAIINCTDQPPPLANGGVTNEFQSFYTVGTIVTYACNSGFRFSSEATTRICQRNRMWSMEDIECEAVSDSDGLSDGAIAGIIIGVAVAVVIVIVLVVILGICLWLRHKERSGKFTPSYDTQDQPPKIHKTDIGQPVLPEDAEAGTAETQMTESNEMLIN